MKCPSRKTSSSATNRAAGGFDRLAQSCTTTRARCCKRFNVAIDPATPVRQLGVGEKQLVEIVKALAKNSRILILDEPTAALAEHEVQTLLDHPARPAPRGIACIYISHSSTKSSPFADRITVLRDGATIITLDTARPTKPKSSATWSDARSPICFRAAPSKPRSTLCSK